MKKLSVILISVLSLNTGAADFNLVEEKDEFTDQKAVFLTIINDAITGGVDFRCQEMNFFMQLPQPGLYLTGETVEVKFRFDSNKLISREMRLLQSKHVFSLNKNFIMKMLEEFKNSEKAIVKIGTEATTEFTQYNGIAQVIDEFIVKSKENNCIN